MCRWKSPQNLNCPNVKYYLVNKNLTSIIRVEHLDSYHLVLEYECDKREIHYIQTMEENLQSENFNLTAEGSKRHKLLEYLKQINSPSLGIVNRGNMCHWISSLNFLVATNSICELKSSSDQYSDDIVTYCRTLDQEVKSRLEKVGYQYAHAQQQDPTEHLLSKLEYLLPKEEWWSLDAVSEHWNGSETLYGRRESEKQYKIDLAINGSSIEEIVKKNLNVVEEIELTKYDPPGTIKKFRRYNLSYKEKIPSLIIISLKRWNNNGSMITSNIIENEIFENEGIRFILHSIIYKHGNSPNSGHYTCLIRSRGNGFIHINDSRESKYESFDDWQKHKGEAVSYIFLYRTEVPQ